MMWSRRRVLKAGGALAGVSAGLLTVPAMALGAKHGRFAGSASQAQRKSDADANSTAGSKRISLVNLHTAEHLNVEFFREGAYVPEALSAIQVLLRDFRSGERHVIDPHLMDYLVDVAHTMGVEPSFSVISGYRSPQTNASLRDKSTGVAEHSLHMEGRAIDVRMLKVDCASLAAHAQDLMLGGVGYYRGSDFVHLDTGKFRTWKG